jgi:hypothetical protein
MNIHLPAILGFTRYQGFDPSPYVLFLYIFNSLEIQLENLAVKQVFHQPPLGCQRRWPPGAHGDLAAFDHLVWRMWGNDFHRVGKIMPKNARFS